MLHLANIFYIIAFFFIGIILTVGVYTYFSSEKSRVWKYWILYLSSLTLLLVSLGLDWYQRVFDTPGTLLILPQRVIDYSALILCIYSLPNFIHALLKVKISPHLIRIQHLLIAVTIVLGISRVLFPIQIFARVSYSLLLFTTVLYCLILGIRKRNCIRNCFVKNAIITFLLGTLLLLPYFIWDLWFNPTPYRLSFPLYLFFIGIFGLVFYVKKINAPSYLEEGSLTEHLRISYDLTDREMDIIRSVIQGNTNKEVASIHFISVKTVEAHLSRIFKKVGVSNRVQLLNVVHEPLS